MITATASSHPVNAPHPHLESIREWPADAAITEEQYRFLLSRLIAAYSYGLTPIRLATGAKLDLQWLEVFTKNSDAVQGSAQRLYSGQPTLFEDRIQKLSAALAEFEAGRAKKRFRVETTVTRAIGELIHRSRTHCGIVLGDASPGLGKTAGVENYVAKARAAEGFGCSVWHIQLDEVGISHKVILGQIADEIIGAGRYDNRTEFATKAAIVSATEGMEGVLIIDEAQHLATNELQGAKILNSLRTFAREDKACFGLVLLGNGEIYQRHEGGKKAQLSSRIDYREAILGLTEGEEAASKAAASSGRRSPPRALQQSDVRAVAASWGVTDIPAVALSIEIARLPGALRTLATAYRNAEYAYGEITHAALKKVRETMINGRKA